LSGKQAQRRNPFALPYPNNANDNNRASLLGRRITYAPIKEQRLVTLLFQLDAWHVASHVKPLEFVCHLIRYQGSYRGAQALLSALRAKGWALSISCYSQDGLLFESHSLGFLFLSHTIV
jgi:secreted Zn-dependent insulinase-like peptidase